MDKKQRRTDGTYYIPFIILLIANILHGFFTYLSITGEGQGVLAILVCILFHAPLAYLIIPLTVFLITIRRSPRAVILTIASVLVYVAQILIFYIAI
ncbi:MAG: hypothetical protein IJW61_02695 [Clostridia bacterium]|nr:hypothetical protein [Clostridia bacterium]